MRIFFCLQPPASVRQALWELQTRLKQTTAKPIPVENLHLTLAFLGNVKANVIDDLVFKVDAHRFYQLSLTLDEIGYFARPSILYAGCSHVPADLYTIAKTLRKIAHQTGIRMPLSKFIPHVTLFRHANLTSLEIDVDIKWRPNQFVLMESILSPRGARYHVLAKFPLLPAKTKQA